MNRFDPEAALQEVLDRKNVLRKKYKHQKESEYTQYGSTSELLIAANACDTNLLLELRLREMLEAKRPVTAFPPVQQNEPAA